MSKKHSNPGGFVFSTDPNFRSPFENDGPAAVTPAKNQQKLRLRLETKGRGGKPTTVVDGFVGTTEDLEALGKQLKTKAGTGGSAKDGIILIQGDIREKAVAWLKEWGYGNTK